MPLQPIDWADKNVNDQVTVADIAQIKSKVNAGITLLNALAGLFTLDGNGLPTAINNSALPNINIAGLFSSDFTVSGGLISLAGGNQLPVPNPLTNGVVDDAGDTFTGTLPNGYSATDVERTFDGGSTWASITSLPLAVGNVAFGVGQVGLRIKATSERQHSTTLFNQTAFTVSGGGGNPDAGFVNITAFNLGNDMVATGNSIAWTYVSPDDNVFWNNSTLKGLSGGSGGGFEYRFTVDPTKNSGLFGLSSSQGGGYSPNRMQWLRSSDTHGSFQTITGNNTYISSPGFDFTTPPRGRIKDDGTHLTLDYSVDGGATWINIQTIAANTVPQYLQGGFVYFNSITQNNITNIMGKGLVAA